MSKRCAIMQPTYLPWAGYFNLISQVDIFVFLDDVQYVRRYWHSRNRILVGDGDPRFITVPVHSQQTQTLNTIKIDDSQKWRDKHIKTLSHAYAKHPFKDEAFSVVFDTIKDLSIRYLSELNIKLILDLSRQLNLCPDFVKASDISVYGKRSKYLLALCENLGCDEYLSPLGASGYLEEDAVFNNSNVTLLFQNFTTQPYPQQGNSSFISHLSIFDVVANLGWQNACHYVC
ncbi:MAG: WbqC family protein [Moorea sp. SIOASIH]|uniref:WbqC family protein n=1 Tax=Moorena sp. SIOASIH TaxID=2607817 RepID=UPI0013B720F6|nr:WbqC family protein [Moorena sp. SIOASIH]NEO35151.1 WbqC family protein [Moorena sp. SIOASIH]